MQCTVQRAKLKKLKPSFLLSASRCAVFYFAEFSASSFSAKNLALGSSKAEKAQKKAHPKSRNAASGCAYIQIKKIKALL